MYRSAANWVVNNTHSAPILRITFRRSSSSAQLQCHKQVHSRVCFDRAQLLAICKPPISSTTNRTATEVGRSTDGWRIFSIKSRLSTPFPRELSSQPTFQICQLRSFRSPPSSVCEVHSRVSISKSRAISASLESNSAMSVTGLSVRLSPP